MTQSLSTPLAVGLIGAALVTIGLGCGSQEAPDPAATILTESKSAPDRPISPHGKAYVEYSDGRVTAAPEESRSSAPPPAPSTRAEGAIPPAESA